MLIIFICAFLCGSLNVTVIHLIDFLKYIENPVEIIALPYLGFALGLFLKNKWLSQKAHWMFVFQLVMLPVILFWLPKACFLLGMFGVFFFIGQLISAHASEVSKNKKYYSIELLGWTLGAVLTYLCVPLLGIERIYVLYVMMGTIVIYLVANNKMSLVLMFSIVVVGAICLTAKPLTIYDYVQKIENPRKKERTNTFWNAKYALSHLDGELQESRWTAYSKLDVIQIKEQKYLYIGADWALPITDDLVELPPSNNKKSLVLGVGTGADLSLLEKFGYRDIVGIELIPELVAIMKTKYAPKLFSRHQIVVTDGRYYLRNTKEKFALILHSYPDLPSNFGSDGMPHMNSLDSDEAFNEAFERLEPNGLFITKSAVKANSDLSLQLWPLVLFIKNVPSASREQIMVYSGEKSPITHKTPYLVITKNGVVDSNDKLEVDKIYSQFTQLTEESVKALIVEIKEKKTLFNRSPNSMGYYKFTETIIGFYVAAFVILFLFFALMYSKLSGSYDYTFLSGLFFVVLQMVTVIKVSFYLSNVSLAYILVIAAMSVSAGVNMYFIKKTMRYKFLEVLSPMLSVIIALVLFIFLELRIFANSQAVIFILVLLSGLFSSFNYTANLSNLNKLFASLQSKNLLGCVAGSAVVVIVFRAEVSAHWLLLVGMFYPAAQITYKQFTKNSKLKSLH